MVGKVDLAVHQYPPFDPLQDAIMFKED
jgi:hypothetical protein